MFIITNINSVKNITPFIVTFLNGELSYYNVNKILAFPFDTISDYQRKNFK